MRSRKAFLVTAGAASAAVFAPAPATASTPSPSPSATATPSPSPAARELALRMRTFDPTLSDEQIDTIAALIEQNIEAGKTLRKHHALQNGDGPTPAFAVGE